MEQEYVRKNVKTASTLAIHCGSSGTSFRTDSSANSGPRHIHHAVQFRIYLLLISASIDLPIVTETIFKCLRNFFHFLFSNNASHLSVSRWISVVLYRRTPADQNLENHYPIRLTQNAAAHDCDGLVRVTLKARYKRLVFQRVNQYRRLLRS